MTPASSLFNLKVELIPDTGVASLQQLPDLGTAVGKIYTNVSSVAGLLLGAQPDIGVDNVSLEANDGAVLASGDFTASSATRTGVHALLKADLFNMLCVPPYLANGDIDDIVLTAAAKLCRDRRAFLIIDAPSAWDEISDAVSDVNGIAATVGTDNVCNAAVFFPRLRMPNPLR